jgi:putative flavoprotein involved in K+ transport
MNRAWTGERAETVVVGGGQAGLAVAYHLSSLGRRCVVLDAGDRIGDGWRRRWDSLRLFTPNRYNGLPGMPFPGPAHAFPTKDEVAEYLEAYAARFDLTVHTGTTVERLAHDGGRYMVESGVRSVEADNVVVATGAFGNPWTPTFADQLDPDIVQLHSSEYRNPSQLSDGDTLVVGAGNSGAEIALDVASRHRTWLSGRDTGVESPFRVGSLPDRLLTPPSWFVLSRVLTVGTRAGRKLRQKARTMGWPLVRVKPADIVDAGVHRVPRTEKVLGGRPVLDDGRVLDVANVIWCTGFRPDHRWIDVPDVDADGTPRHERGVVTMQPGLYFVGLPFQSSATSALLGGVGRDAAAVARHVASIRRKPRTRR